MISLRPIVESDADFFWRWQHDVVDPAWKHWDGPYFPDGEKPTRADFDLSHLARVTSPNQRLIVEAGAPLGSVSRYEEAPAGGGWWEMGIVIFDSQYWGGGRGSEALAQWTASTFAETSAHVITVTTWSGNERMIRAAERVGYVECARIPQARAWQGRRWDSVKLAVLREDARPTSDSESP